MKLFFSSLLFGLVLSLVSVNAQTETDLPQCARDCAQNNGPCTGNDCLCQIQSSTLQCSKQACEQVEYRESVKVFQGLCGSFSETASHSGNTVIPITGTTITGGSNTGSAASTSVSTSVPNTTTSATSPSTGTSTTGQPVTIPSTTGSTGSAASTGSAGTSAPAAGPTGPAAAPSGGDRTVVRCSKAWYWMVIGIVMGMVMIV